ncbi:MAG: nucleotidyltransferase family protein [Candidatus Nanoarchaeia archaeon]|nr:nucleotidyltransferase family protein [Candidatus Nanoarchaeia archaeon]
MKAMLISAGYAVRMYPLTLDKPKALLKVKEKPIIEYVIKKIEDINQVDRIIIVSNNKFYNQFIKWNTENKGKFSKKIEILNDTTNDETEKLGTVGDLIYGLEKAEVDDDIIVLNTDNLFDFSLNQAIDIFNERKKIVNGIFLENDKEKIKRHGVVKISGSRIMAFEEKPENPESNIKSIGVYIFPREKVPKISEYKKSGKDVDKIGNLIKHFCENDEVHGCLFEGRLYDIGTIDAYNEANRIWSE